MHINRELDHIGIKTAEYFDDDRIHEAKTGTRYNDEYNPSALDANQQASCVAHLQYHLLPELQAKADHNVPLLRQLSERNDFRDLQQVRLLDQAIKRQLDLLEKIQEIEQILAK